MARVVGLGLAVLLSVVASSRLTSGATISYSDLSGNNVNYIKISEDTRLEPQALFGPPDIVGDTMDFDPPSFTAQVSSAVGTNVSKIVDGQLNFTVQSKGGYKLTTVRISEAGDFTLAGLGGATAQAAMFTPVIWSVTHVDGSPLPNPVSGNSELVFTPGSSVSLPTTNGLWSGLLNVDIAGFLSSQGISGSASTVEFVLNNSLSVSAANGGSAFLAKKDFAGVTITIPEPAMTLPLAILLLGALRLASGRRR